MMKYSWDSGSLGGILFLNPSEWDSKQESEPGLRGTWLMDMHELAKAVID
jgi:hypothetical protein